MARDSKIRLAVANDLGERSRVWKFWTSKNELYALHRTLEGNEKLSFHSSRICRRAFIGEHPLPSHMSDRVMQRWIRAASAPAGEGKAVKVLTIIFPTSSLSSCDQVSTNNLKCLPAPDMGMARHVQLVFTKEPQEKLVSEVEMFGKKVEWFHSMPNGENVAILTFLVPWSDETVIVHGFGLDGMDTVFPGMATPGVDRPIFFTSYSQPDEMVCIELSGFKMIRDAAQLVYPSAGTFTRTGIIDK